LEKLPTEIDELEQKIAAIHKDMADPEFFKGAGERIAEVQKQLADHEANLVQAMTRWEELESLA